MKTPDTLEDALTLLMDNLTLDTKLSNNSVDVFYSLMSAIDIYNALTVNQGHLLIKLFSENKKIISETVNIEPLLAFPVWKYKFRILDITKSVSIEKDDIGKLWILLKFPYQLIKDFEESISVDKAFQEVAWDAERRLKKLNFYDFNIIAINEFVIKHDFFIDNTFVEAVNRVEEIWQQEYKFKPYSVIENNKVVLQNAVTDALTYFNQYRTEELNQDLFLAKSMGFVATLDHPPVSVVEKIASDSHSHFWMKSNKEFFQLYQEVDSLTAIIIDRNTKDVLHWLTQFLKAAKDAGVNTDEFRVCYRESKNNKIMLNDWIKENNLGGSVESGKLFIFLQKPAKWIFSKKVDIKIIGTNSYSSVTDMPTAAWMVSHPCVCYISNIRPTKIRNKQIASL
jgi:hypothetical protein